MPAPDTPPDERWISVARLLRPQGRKGELLTEPQTDLPEIFIKGRQLRLASADSRNVATAPSITLEDCWRPQGRNAGRLVLKLAGVDSISAAEALGGKELFLLESELPALDEDTFLVRDLIGCQLFDGDRLLGTVTDLHFPIAADGRTRIADAADLLAIEPANPSTAPHPIDSEPVDSEPAETEPTLVPFVKAWLTSVDLPNKRITMQLPPGLFD